MRRRAYRQEVSDNRDPGVGGLEPGVTAAVSKRELPAATVEGVASPVPVGLVGPGPPHGLVPARLFLGFWEPVEKFEVLLSVSTHPPPALIGYS